MLEVPNPVPVAGHSTAERAKMIVERARFATNKEPDWYNKLVCTQDKDSGEYVLTGDVFKGRQTADHKRDEWLITLDQKEMSFLARRHGVSRQTVLQEIGRAHV